MTNKTKQSKTTLLNAEKGTVKTSKKVGTIKTSKKKKKVGKKSKKDTPKTPINKGFKIKYIDTKGLKHIDILQEFLRWIALPKIMRTPRTQGGFSKKFGIGEDTLSDWKKLDGFWDDVKPYRNEYFRESTGEVLEGLKMRARLGKSKEVKLFMQIFEQFSEKLEVEETQPRELTKEQKEEISKRFKLWQKKVRDNMLKKNSDG